MLPDSLKVSASTPLRTGKTLVDITGDVDANYSTTITGGGIWLVGSTSNADREGYAMAQLRTNGQRDFDYSRDAIQILPQNAPFDDRHGLAAYPYGRILTSLIVNGGDTYGLNVLSVDSTLNARPDKYASVALPPESATPAYSSVQIEADSTFLASARSNSMLSLAHFSYSGVLDVSLGSHGVATYALPEGLQFASSTPLTLQSNGQLIVAGHSYLGTHADFSVVRFNADGTLDATFGKEGIATFDIAEGHDFAHAVAVQADGKLLIAGNSETSASDVDFSVIRLNQDGSLDTSFGDNGKAIFDFQAGPDTAQTINVRDDGRILLTGSGQNTAGNADFAALQLNPNGTLDTTFGDRADGLHYLTGGYGNNFLAGTREDESISGAQGNDLLDGGAGRDHLSGGAGTDVFRFTERDHSYRSVSAALTDRVVDFNPVEDVLDLSALGYTGLGDGHDGTLAVRVNASGTRTYLKSFDADVHGHRFELALDGDVSDGLHTSSIEFVTAIILGDDYQQRIYASNLGAELHGENGDDHLIGGMGHDILDGGAGRDVIYGFDGADIFHYSQLTDSYRTANQSYSDLIVDFDVFTDRIDVSALGFTALGNGHDGTLAVTASETEATTYLKSYDTNGAGERFQVTLGGDLAHLLSNELFVFAQAGLPDIEALGIAELSA
ncbi:hypothetical protein [Pseudomonas japonica]|nr:hypothetical protein [Pseudomonas japonica]MBA1290617.1 hypothetical protein [Pseudomonas japonica]